MSKCILSNVDKSCFFGMVKIANNKNMEHYTDNLIVDRKIEGKTLLIEEDNKVYKIVCTGNYINHLIYQNIGTFDIEIFFYKLDKSEELIERIDDNIEIINSIAGFMFFTAEVRISHVAHVSGKCGNYNYMRLETTEY